MKKSLQVVALGVLVGTVALGCKARVGDGSGLRSESPPDADIDTLLAGLDANLNMVANEVGLDVAILTTGENPYSGYALADGDMTPQQAQQKIDELKAQFDDLIKTYKDGDDGKVKIVLDQLTSLQAKYPQATQQQQQQAQQAIQTAQAVVDQTKQTSSVQGNQQGQAPDKASQTVVKQDAPSDGTSAELFCVKMNGLSGQYDHVLGRRSDSVRLDLWNGLKEAMTQEMCEQVISAARNGVVCGRGGTQLARIYRVKDWKQVGGNDHGHSFIGGPKSESCSMATLKSKPDKVCAYAGALNVHAYEISTGKALTETYGNYLSRCMDNL